MASDSREEIAEKRLQRVLRTHGVASARVLEQKIADAGPNPQRIDPHILTTVRTSLMKRGVIRERNAAGLPWYFLASTPLESVNERLIVLSSLHAEAQTISNHVGQSLEIAVLRALRECDTPYFGDFPDLDDHSDSTLYSKEEPPAAISGRRIPGKARLDFLVAHREAGFAGIEVKNIREWFYPDREEIRAMLGKCCALDVVPILIARRINYSAFSVLNPCGILIHQTFNQLYPNSAAELTTRLRRKDLLGYHDIRLIDAEDAATTHARLKNFITVHLPKLLPSAREAFNKYKDLLERYASDEYTYKEFAARVKRRQRGEPEDFKGV